QNPGVADELVHTNVDVIVTWGTPATVAAQHATATIPIVMVAVGDPVGSGFIASLARPGGNVTGVSNITTDLTGKQVQLLVEIVPGMSRIGVVHNSNNPAVMLALQEAEDAIHALGMQLELVDASAPEEFESAFAHLRTEGVKSVLLIADASLVENARRIAKLA